MFDGKSSSSTWPIEFVISIYPSMFSLLTQVSTLCMGVMSWLTWPVSDPIVIILRSWSLIRAPSTLESNNLVYFPGQTLSKDYFALIPQKILSQKANCICHQMNFFLKIHLQGFAKFTWSTAVCYRQCWGRACCIPFWLCSRSASRVGQPFK